MSFHEIHRSVSLVKVLIYALPIIYTFLLIASSYTFGTKTFQKGFSIPTDYFSFKFDKTALSDQLLHNTIRDKIQYVNRLISDGDETRPPLDPYNLDSLFILLNDEQSRLNASITSINLHGLSHMKLKDIASNTKTKRVGTLLLFPDIKITGYYKINGLWSDDCNKYNATDRGKFKIVISEWRSSWSAKILDLTNDTLTVSQMAIRSYYDDVTQEFNSYIDKSNDMQKRNNLTELISTLILDKVSKIVDEKLEQLFGEVVIESPFDSDINSQWSKIIRSHNARRKRQVPCEIGDELDEYVDSLFRFAKRLIRVMEPFQLPNATIDLEDYNLQLFLHSGGASRAYTLERKKPAWVLCTNETISLGLTVQLEEIRVMYKYRVIQDWRLLFDGELEVQIMRPKVQIQITQSVPKEESEDDNGEGGDGDEEEEPVMQRIDRLKIWRPGNIRVIVRGLGNLTQAISMIINSMLSNTESLDPIIKMVETDGVAAANTLLKNISIPIFSII